MIFKWIALGSLVLAAAAAFGGPLWLAPVWFAAAFAGLTVLALLVIIVAFLLVDERKPREKDSPFYRALTEGLVQLLIPLARVRLHTQGLEKTPGEGRFLLVCNHLGMPDPAVLVHCFKDSQLAFISKRENDNMFVVGKLMHTLRCQLINRENDREALKTILSCIRLIKDDENSIAVFPEGYTSLDGKLHHFRSGVFKIAQKTGVPILVCTLQNTDKILHNFLRLRTTDVHLHLVQVIQPEEYRGKSTIEIANEVYEMMIADLGEEYRSPEN
ncbi:MAG: lysophospholipid acyltransferase family protein [Eubacteriales bacterium]|nr:lysophospholipid acyltransferase family protein [Eubacteriales bacterium]